ncbi:nitrite reductase small subunit NirD [Allonocardiopsis opalescens]|uniref:Nitrite reductase (NADH) small subunit n=1 Tax=Allonocardiopsis opalescens TaxID=1144618 RepID=A0A2T0PXI7_9ACTN|nr:nitrite reductase small subunit NirD [Allonocardiopsis opalescens]PRX96253.1 nitrite reductase (NADH) small subunit [Allonocardiopsis opalescens]
MAASTLTPGPANAPAADTRWLAVCPAERLVPERGAAVLLPDGTQAAVFRTHDGALYAVDNRDPFSGAQVMARGIVGDRAGEPTVASPMHKQVFSLRTGACLDSPGTGLRVFEVSEAESTIRLAAPAPVGGGAAR